MQFAKKLIGNKEERAVSPVIGVILMVAITVILAAVIAAFVLDLGQSQSANVNAGVSFDDSGSNVSVQLTDDGNADFVVVQGIDSGMSPGGTCVDKTAEGYSDCALDSVGDSVSHDKSSVSDITIIAVSGDNKNVINNWP